MLRYLFVSIFTASILIFHNCSTGKNLPVGFSFDGGQNGRTVADKILALDLDLKTASSLQVHNVRNTVAMTPQDLLVKPDVYYYLINLADGRIQSFDVNSKKLNFNFCLTNNDRVALENILHTAQICEPNSEKSGEQGDRFCTMEYVMPYAKLNFPSHIAYALGERNSGCDIPIDLCGDHSALLRGFVRSLLLNIKTKICMNTNKGAVIE
jgi:hypothetical protein